VPYRGHAGLRASLADNKENFEVFEPEFRELRDLGDRVLAVGTIHIRARGSGVETDIPTAGIATFEQGKLTRWEDFRDRVSARRLAGNKRTFLTLRPARHERIAFRQLPGRTRVTTKRGSKSKSKAERPKLRERPDEALKDLQPGDASKAVRGGACASGKHYPDGTLTP
jgi:hypothetical protein